MRKRRPRPQGAAPTGSPSVLSDPSTEALATPSRPVGVRSSGGIKRPSTSGPHLGGGDVLNAFWQKGDLTLVVPADDTDNGIRYKRLRAEHSCFIRRSDIEDESKFVRMLNHHHAVRKTVIEGEWLRVSWRDRDATKHYCKRLHEATDDRAAIPTYEGMVSPVLRHMVDNGLRPAPPRRCWVDIETDSRVPFSLATEGETRILCWVVVDFVDGKPRVVGRGMLNEDSDADEERLLRELWDALEHYDQVCAWNGDRFDFPIIKARSNRYGLLRGAIREWRRWLWLDHLLLYQRMNMAAAESGDEKTSMALDSVAQAILGIGKHAFDASQTWEAWAAGGRRRQELIDYCEQDTVLMPLIEDKTGFIMLLQTVADTCGTFPDTRGSNPGVQVEGFLARLAHKLGHKFPTVIRAMGGDRYEGAFVLHPEKNAGVHRDVHVADFASLYPTIICTWNMSPETIVDNHDDIDALNPASHSPLTDQYFTTSRQGILPLAVSQLMELRAKWNDAKSAATPGTVEWKDADRRSAAYKITANSFYGVIGAPTSRHYDVRVAESVTQCGKWLILETIRAAEERRMKVIYGDTDSLFVAGASREKFEAFVSWCNTDLYPSKLAELGCPTNRIKLAYEKQFDRLIFTTAKRYVGNYTHYKGTDADASSKPEIKGLEFKRGDSLKVTRQLQEEVSYALVGFNRAADEDPDDPATFHEIVGRWQEFVLQDPLPLDTIVISKRLNKPLADYTANQPFIRIAKEMDERGEDVGEGAKIAYVVTGPVDSPQSVLRADEYDPAATDIDRDAMWEKLVWPPTRRLLDAAFPDEDWSRYEGMVKARRAREAAERRAEKKAARLAAKAAEAHAPPPTPAEPDPGPMPRPRRRRPQKAAEPSETPVLAGTPRPRPRRRMKKAPTS